MEFTYAPGQRVLDAYTLTRGLGRDELAEVYHAVTDEGRDVALKLIHACDGEVSPEDLRGLAQCLHLQHPHLLTLHDLRTSGEGDSWLVMEYTRGEPLRDILSRHRQGLPLASARQWFVELTRGLAYLHDHGLLHRNLRPSNVFVDAGTVKIGDYGLTE